MLSIILVAAAGIADPSGLPKYGIDAPNVNVSDGIIYSPTIFTMSADQAHRDRLIAFREEALDQQTRDGGTLTQQHRAELQEKLDRIQLRFAEARRRADVLAVDANGHALYSASTRPLIVSPSGMRFARGVK